MRQHLLDPEEWVLAQASSHMLWRMQHAVIIRGADMTSRSHLFCSIRHLDLSFLKAISTHIRVLERYTLKLSCFSVKLLPT